MPDTSNKYVAGVKIGMFDSRIGLRNDELIKIRPECNDARVAVGRRFGELIDEITTHTHLLHNRMWDETRGQSSRVWRTHGYKCVDVFIATESLHEITPDEPTHGMADHVHAIVAGLLPNLGDKVTETNRD